MLMQVKFPIEPFNTYVRDGSIGAKMQKIMADLKPESAYFTAVLVLSVATCPAISFRCR